MSTTYSSGILLDFGQVPEDITDPILYQEFLDIHNAIEALADVSGGALLDYVNKQRTVTDVSEDYQVVITDGTIRVDASTQAITITLPIIAGNIGYKYKIKRVDTTPANKVIILGTGSELIDGHADGIRLSTKSSYTTNAHTDGWDIV